MTGPLGDVAAGGGEVTVAQHLAGDRAHRAGRDRSLDAVIGGADPRRVDGLGQRRSRDSVALDWGSCLRSACQH